ncbi:MAG: fatty acid desaturase [Pseudomonadota bacterium]
MDHKTFLSSITPRERARLTETADGPGLRHLAGHAGAIAVLAVWVGLDLPFWPLAILPLGIALAFLFTLQHECTHRTPFRTPWLNEALGHLTGLILFQPFEWFRAFHMAHHRHTNDPEHDPELEGSKKPETWRAFVWYLAGADYWRAKLRTLLVNAGGGDDAEYISGRARPRIQREAVAMLAVYVFLAAFTVLVSPILFWLWLLPLLVGFPVLRLYLLAEHGRCPAVADMFDNTRTTLTNRTVRFLAWNMPYHAEHHAWPTVPFHRLPALHEIATPHLKRVSDGYLRFSKETWADLQD